MKKIILDTNFLLIPIEFKVDIFDEIDRISTFNYKLYIIDKTLDELDNIIEKQRGKSKEAARFAKQLIKLKKLETINTKEDDEVDKIILDTVNKDEYIVATQDKLLKKKLMEKKIPIIILRQKKHLKIQGKI